MSKELKELKELIEKGNKKVYIAIRKTSRSNLTWYFNIFTVIDDELIDITDLVATTGLFSLRKLKGWGYCLVGAGVGTNRSFEVAYNLGSLLYNDGYQIKGYFI